MKINIAIDGPAGSGKSSVGNIISNKLNYQFIDTGLTYRAFTYYCVINKVEFTNHKQLKEYLKHFNYQIKNNNIFLNKQNVTNKLQTNLVLDNINKITSLDFVRNTIVNLQKSLAINKGNVMVGRDITTVILPNAELKIYLTASLKKRTERRLKQEQNKGININSFEDIFKKLKIRDESDKNRTVGPLTISNDAIIIDNSDITFDETVKKIYQLALEKIK